MADKKIVPFLPEHLEKINLSEVQKHVSFMIDEIPNGPSALKEVSLMAVTYLDGEEIIGCFGVTKDRYVWAAMGEKAKEHIVFIAKTAKAVLDTFDWCYTLNRMTDKKSNRWVELLGFKCEGIVKTEDDGLEYINYLRMSQWALKQH